MSWSLFRVGMALSFSIGCLIKMMGFSVMRKQDAMATITPGQSRTQMCVRLWDLQCHSYMRQIAVCFASVLYSSFLTCSVGLCLFLKDCPVSRHVVISDRIMIALRGFSSSRCCSPPNRQTMTSSTPSWVEVILCQARLSGPLLPVTVGSVKTLPQTRWTALSAPRAPLGTPSISARDHKPRQNSKPMSPLTSVSHKYLHHFLFLYNGTLYSI